MSNPLNADIAIIGSGFAGSLASIILKKLGFTTVLLDKSEHPRFSIGESSTPIGNLLLRDLAKRYDLPWLSPLTAYGAWQDHYPQLGVGRKRGFSYFNHTSGQSFSLRADHSNELLVAASKDNQHSDTHWFRSDVDAFIFNQAKEAGVLCYENTAVQQMKQDSVWTISCVQGATSFDLKANFIIDASGRAGALGHFLNVPSQVASMRTQTRAIFTHLDALPTWHDFLVNHGQVPKDHPFYCDDSAVHHLMGNAWLWMLRFNSGRTSVGLVLDESIYGKDIEVHDVISEYPSLQLLLESATYAVPTPEWITTGRVQHWWAQAAGPNWAMLPHTAAFVDPMHSTGIAHTLCGMERLISILQHHWGSPSLARSLENYDRIMHLEIDHVDQLVAGCYRALNHFELFTAYSMLYFASAITYEEDRIAHVSANSLFNRYFLCAEDEGLRNTIGSTYNKLLSTLTTDLTDESVSAFIAETKQRIAPYNTAGLFSPRVRNMYEYTATV